MLPSSPRPATVAGFFFGASMNYFRAFTNLLRMRRRAGAGWIKSALWAKELLLHNHRASKARAQRQRREEVERAGHQAL